MVNALDFGVPSSRKRLIAGSVAIVKALERRKGSGPTVLPVHALPVAPPRRALPPLLGDLQPARQGAAQRRARHDGAPANGTG